MRSDAAGLLACYLVLFSACLSAADIRGKVVDPTGAPISGAHISAVTRVGIEAQALTGPGGAFRLNAPDVPNLKLVVTAPGFSTRAVAPADAALVQLSIAPHADSIEVIGSPVPVPASEQGGSVSVIPAADIRRRNEAFALDLLRYLPGMAFNQTGSPGGVTGLFLRGGYANFNLVQIDGIPVNSFGGAFDFAHVAAATLDRIEVIRGPQSALYGPYANSGVINFVTRQPEAAPRFDLLFEAGSHRLTRAAVGAAGAVAGFGIALSTTRFDDRGSVPNSDYRNQGLALNITRRVGRQNLALHGDLNSNDAGEPGPWGSDPKGTYSGFDLISRAKTNSSDYYARWQADLSERVRQELTGSFFVNRNGFTSPYGFAFNKDLRGGGEARTLVSVSPHYIAVLGLRAGREQVENTYVTGATFETFPLRRDDIALYFENRVELGGRFFLNAGLRVEFLRTSSLPSDGFSRPFIPLNTISSVNPRLSAAWLPAPRTRLHAALATGIRPPSGFEMAFTNNPALSPERTRSFEAGLEQKLFGQALLLDATWFHNRYTDLIVTLGGSLASLSRYQSANLANSLALGMEFSASLRPARWVLVAGSYTLLRTRILSLDGSRALAPLPFQVGQQLTRRPAHSGNAVATFTRGRASADITAYLRGRTLFEEPGFGASNGLFWNDGYANVGLNLNYAVRPAVTVYGSLRNALNWHYEEVYGFPSPRLHIVAGMKWRLR